MSNDKMERKNKSLYMEGFKNLEVKIEGEYPSKS